MGFQGLVSAAYTPMSADGSLDLSGIDRLAEVCRTSGVDGVFVCGTTGESLSLTVEERRDVARRWVEVLSGELPVIVHVGHNCVVESASLARHAREVGAQAVAAMSPTFFRPSTVDELVGVCAEIAASAEDLPFYYYDIPSMTGVHVPVDRFLDAASDRIPNLGGVKFTQTDLAMLQNCLSCGDGTLDILFGCDEMLLAALALGVRGAVGSTYNYAAPLYVELISAFNAGDWERARDLQRRSVGLVEVLKRFGVLRAGKAIMGLLGAECGPVRSPLTPLSRDDIESLALALAEFDDSGCFPRTLRGG